MKRRSFIKKSALSTALISTSGIYYSCQTKNKGEGESRQIDCLKPANDIPVINDTDVFIAGGSSAAISAAVWITKNGGKAFLCTDHPYLGEDIVGSFNFWNTGTPQTSLATKLFKGKNPKNPIFYKRVLNDELVNNKIDFLFSSFVTDILLDNQGDIAGVVISNRSGQQAIRAKVIVDATQYATVARVWNIPFQPFIPGKRSFKYRAVGNEKKDGYPVRVNLAEFALSTKPVPVLEYSLEFDFKTDTFREIQRAEQLARSKTWAPNQMDSADDLEFAPNNKIIGKKSFKGGFENWDFRDVSCFQPEKTNDFYILNGYADVSGAAMQELMKPCNLMAVGEHIAEAALESSKKKQIRPSPVIADTQQNKFEIHEVKNGYDFVRPSYVKGNINPLKKSMPILGEFDVLVMGGGTAGAPAALSASRHGAKTLIVEYLHGLGGTGTMGMIGAYFHGYQKGFTKILDKAVNGFGGANHPRALNKHRDWINDWKMEYYRSEAIKSGCEIWFGAIGIGALLNGNKVEGVVLATPFGKGIVKAKKIIDSTGSADIAIAAGAAYKHTDKDCLAVQGAGLPPIMEDRNYCNTDWTFVNDTDVFDVWRTFVAGTNKFDDTHYDVGKLPQTRERRRVVGDYEISVLDVYNNRTYHDSISIHKSSFDTHGFTIDPFFNLKPPKEGHIDEIAYVPLRSLLPKGLENILVTGLGASAHRDAMPVIRMQPCLQNQGYTVGYMAALAVKQNKTFREIDVKEVQKMAVEIKSLPETALTDKDNYPPSDGKIKEALHAVANKYDQLETILWDLRKGISAVEEAFKNVENDNSKLHYAVILAYYGNPVGWKTIDDDIKSIPTWDKGWDYTGMGQFGACMSPLDAKIIALGKTKQHGALETIMEKASLLHTDDEFSHFRAISLALENFSDVKSREVLFQLLNLANIQGHAITSIQIAKQKADPSWTTTKPRNQSLKELVLARALYITGDMNGLGNKILTEYARDLRGHYARHAIDVINAV